MSATVTDSKPQLARALSKYGCGEPMTSFRQIEAIEAMRSGVPVRKPKTANGGRGEMQFGTD
jgi:hypothetical protein